MHAPYVFGPSLKKDKIAFIAEDDAWEVDFPQGGVARRLTAGRGGFSFLAYSPDGQWLALSGKEEGGLEIYVMPAQGGDVKRLTYLQSHCAVRGWVGNKILFSTRAQSPHWCEECMLVDPKTAEITLLNYGPSIRMAESSTGAMVVERNAYRPEASHWKRYRGGTAGKFYLRQSGQKEFRRFLQNLNGNLSSPMWVENRLYFVSDHEAGVANIFSVEKDGKKLKQHTFETDYYVRNPQLFENHIVYHAGGRLKALNVNSSENQEIPVQLFSQRPQKQRQLVNLINHFEHASISADGNKISLTARGQIHTAAPWDGAWISTSQALASRWRDRLGTPLDKDAIVFVSDCPQGRKEKDLEGEGLFQSQLSSPLKRELLHSNVGRVVAMSVSPDLKKLALTNHRNELLVFDFTSRKLTTLHTEKFQIVSDFDWSPDSEYLTFVAGVSHQLKQVLVMAIKTRKKVPVTPVGLEYRAARFSPCGEKLFCLAGNQFDPRYEEQRFSLYFDETLRPYMVALKKGTSIPWMWQQAPEKKDEKNTKKTKPKKLQLDVDGIQDRIIPVPVSSGEYFSISVTSKGLILFSGEPAKTRVLVGKANQDFSAQFFDFQTQKQDRSVQQLSRWFENPSKTHVLYRQNRQFRLRKRDECFTEVTGEGANSQTGLLAIGSMQQVVHVENEWQQIFDETWRLQKLYYWEKNLGGVDWDKQYQRYSALLSRIGTREELNDLLWELIGELGVGHAYAWGGDLRQGPQFRIGQLGVVTTWNRGKKAWQVTEVFAGDPWHKNFRNPFLLRGYDISVGDLITQVSGVPVQEDEPLEKMLLGLAGQEVVLQKWSNESKKSEQCQIQTLPQVTDLLYTDWVARNRELVHELSQGKVGYVHIPDMGPDGYATFFEQYLREHSHDALVVDVRFNGGGHVSSLILEKLATYQVGVDQSRWFGTIGYPKEARRGPVVALTNEFAGSDGDIFSHTFKLMKLGPLLGTRTWGGVIGIWPRHQLVDGGGTTQPEFAFWFKDVGWDVENYGTDPDIEIDNFPHDYQKNLDSQLHKAVEQALKEIKRQGVFSPKLPPPPNRGLATLKGKVRGTKAR